MRKILPYLLFLLLFACSKNNLDLEVTKSKDSSLKELIFESANNSSMNNINVYSCLNGIMVYVTVPEGVSLTNLVPTFRIDDAATVSINNSVIENGSTPVDFTECVAVTITSEAGNCNKYYVCVKNGVSKVDNLVYKFMKKYNIPGVSVTFGGEEGNIYSYGYGLANTVTYERVTPNHLFRLASVSKQQTVLAIMTLYEQGKLKIDDRIFGRGGGRVPEETFEDLVKILRKYNVAAEINFHTNHENPIFIKKCLENGVKLSLGSDYHNLYEVGFFNLHIEFIRSLGYNGDFKDILL